MKITIEQSPYGDTGKTYYGMLGFLQHTRLQLISFRSPDKTPEEAQYLENDIAGYEEIINSGQEENAQTFAKIKQEDRMKAVPVFPNNLEIVKHMKENGLWVPAAT